MNPQIRITSIIVMAILSLSCPLYAQSPSMERYDGGFYSLEKPKGWQVYPAGECSTLAFLVRDPEQPLRQSFFFSSVGPFYMSQQQKLLDQSYMNMGGFPVAWIEMPVVEPLTPGNFLTRFQEIASTQVARSFMPQCPRLENLEVISTQAQPSPLAQFGGQTELIRALFKEKGQLGEGLFLLTVAPFMPFMDGPGGGNAYALLFTGITAPMGELQQLEKALVQPLQTFTIQPAYVQNCIYQQQVIYDGILKAGKTLSDASDLIMEGWKNRNRSDDIIAQKRSDAILGNERLYNPDTGQVYQFENGFFDSYNLNRNQYEMSNLQMLPGDNYDLWMQAPLDGIRNLR